MIRGLTRTTTLAAAAAAALWFAAAAPAEAQYRPGPTYGNAYGPPGYVSPRILRKQREKQERIARKYGYVPPGYGYRPPVYRQPRPYGYGYGYGAPVYRPAPGYNYGYNGPAYRPAPAPNYGYRPPVVNRPGPNYGPAPSPYGNSDGLTMQDRIGSAR